MDSAIQSIDVPAEQGPPPIANIQQRFTLGKSLGSGGTGEVHEGVLSLPDGKEKKVAIKVLSEETDDEVGRLRQLVEDTRELTHPNVCLPSEFIASSGGRVLIYELIDGLSLVEVQRRLRRQGRPIPSHLALEITCQVLEGLMFLHSSDIQGRGLIHGSIKPSNIRLGLDGGVRILDVGIRNAKAEPGARNKGLAVVNTLPYMAPEQLGELPKVFAATDLYSLATIAYELLAGRLLFDGSAARRELEIRVGFGVQDKVKALNEIVPGIGSVLSRALAIEVADRFSNASEMFRDIAKVRGEPRREALGKLIKGLQAMPEPTLKMTRPPTATTKVGHEQAKASEILAMFEAPTVPRVVEPVNVKLLEVDSPARARQRERLFKVGMAVLCLAIAFGALWWVDQSRSPEQRAESVSTERALAPSETADRPIRSEN